MIKEELAVGTYFETAIAVGSLVRETQRTMHLLRKKAMEAPLADDLTLDQWLVLDALCDAPRTMTELAEATSITGPTLTRTVDRLISRALVYREVDPGDRRKVRVHLVGRGRKAHEQAAEGLAGIEDAVRTEIERL